MDMKFFVIRTVGDTDTVGILEIKKEGDYNFDQRNKIEYSNEHAPCFLSIHTGTYKIEEAVKGSFTINFSPEEKNKSFQNKLDSELGFTYREGTYYLNYLASTLDGWYIASIKKEK
ncbi:MAG: hypothetical protein ACJ77K_19760 [Bacteroidia bacterium]